jgi:hypothetical protein
MKCPYCFKEVQLPLSVHTLTCEAIHGDKPTEEDCDGCRARTFPGDCEACAAPKPEPEDPLREKAMALCNAWKNIAEGLRVNGRQNRSPLVMLDMIHQADTYEKCAEDLERYIINGQG